MYKAGKESVVVSVDVLCAAAPTAALFVTDTVCERVRTRANSCDEFGGLVSVSSFHFPTPLFRRASLS